MKTAYRIPLLLFCCGFFFAVGFIAERALTPETPQTFDVRAHEPRSGKWPKVRAEHLAKEPACAVCGSTKDLNVHHVKPFHEYHDLELSDANLITLCGPGGHGCHLAWGHLFSYLSWNRTVREDAAAMRAKVKSRPE